MMKVRVHLFEMLRACLPPDAHRGQAEITLPEGATLADLIVHLGIDAYLDCSPEDVIREAGWQVSVSGHFETDIRRVLRDGDTVLMMPHISGG
jgi:molybdopterin converting factor small subunit